MLRDEASYAQIDSVGLRAAWLSLSQSVSQFQIAASLGLGKETHGYI